MSTSPVCIGVGFDTSRYGHHVTFLDAQLTPVCPPFNFPESRAGYDLLLQTFQSLQQRWPDAFFYLRLDAAGQYAANLEAFLRRLPFPHLLSIGEPGRNHNYRKAIFPKRKADPTESFAAARFALCERPSASPEVLSEFVPLREIVARLDAQVRHSTRFTNQLHNLLARVFPELALTVRNLQTAWVLQLLERFPTPALLAQADAADLQTISHVRLPKAQALHNAARTTVASFSGSEAEALVRQLVQQLRASIASEKHLGKKAAALVQALPHGPWLLSIPGIGPASAAVLAAKIIAIERFASPSHLVGFFGVFPEEFSSGLARDGSPKAASRYAMSKKGNDLVRKYLWNAAKTAVRHNPPIRDLYARLRRRGTPAAVAFGHAMRKLLHQVFIVWSRRQPFTSPDAASANENAAGHNQDLHPVSKVVTAASSKLDSAPVPVNPAPASSWVDFALLRSQVTIAQVLDHFGITPSLRGSGPQRRGPCPLHPPLRPRSSLLLRPFAEKCLPLLPPAVRRPRQCP